MYVLSEQKGMTVVPVLGLLSRKEAFKPTPSAAEVDAIFDAPLEMFLKVYHTCLILTLIRLD